MTFLRAANRYYEFDELTGFIESTTSGHFDSAFVSNGFASFTPSNSDTTSYLTLTTPGATTDYWLHFRGYPTMVGSSDSNSNTAWVTLLNASGVAICALFKDGNVSQASKLTVYGTSNVVSAGTILPVVNTEFFVDVHVNVSGSTTTVNVYKDGVLACTATNSNNGGRGIPVKAVMRASNCGYNQFNRMNYSEFIVATHSTLGMRLDELQVASAGFYSDMIGTVTDLNTLDVLTGVLTDAVGERVSWNPVAYAGSGGIAAVIASGRAHRKSGTPSKLAHFLRLSSTDYDGTEQTIDDHAVWQHVWETNPATAVAWAGGDLSGIQVGLKSAT